jgi:hypothetical protein
MDNWRLSNMLTDIDIHRYEFDENEEPHSYKIQFWFECYIEAIRITSNLYSFFDFKSELKEDFITSELNIFNEFHFEFGNSFEIELQSEFFENPNNISLNCAYLIKHLDELITRLKLLIKNATDFNENNSNDFNELISTLEYMLHKLSYFTPNTQYINKIDLNTYFSFNIPIEKIKSERSSKQLWDVKLRYELIKDSQLLKSIQKLNILESEKHEVISQILGVNIDTARNLYYGTYPKGGNKEKEINRKDYFISLLKQ